MLPHILICNYLIKEKISMLVNRVIVWLNGCESLRSVNTKFMLSFTISKFNSLVLSHTFFGRNRVMIEGCRSGFIQGKIFMRDKNLYFSYHTTKIIYFPDEKCFNVVLTPERN